MGSKVTQFLNIYPTIQKALSILGIEKFLTH